MKKKAFLFIVGLIALYVGSCRAEVTLAVIAPKAGEYAKDGKELFYGAELAVKEINNNGGLNGEKIDILTIDDRCDDRLAVSTAEMLTLLHSKDIKIVIGPYCSNRFEETAEIYEKAGIFQIVPTTVAYNTAEADQKGQILLLGTKTQMSSDFFKFYNANFAGLKVGFVYNDKPEEGYTTVAKTLYDEFRRYGKGDLLRFYALNRGDGYFYDLAQALKKDGVEITFVLGKNSETQQFIRMLKNEAPNMIVFTNKKTIGSNVEETLGQAADGLYFLDLPGLKDSLMFTENLVNLRLLGIEPEGLEVYSYVAVKFWGELVQQIKSFAYSKLSDAANSGDVKEKWSDFLMHSGSLGASKYIIEMYKSGEFKQVY